MPRRVSSIGGDNTDTDNTVASSTPAQASPPVQAERTTPPTAATSAATLSQSHEAKQDENPAEPQKQQQPATTTTASSPPQKSQPAAAAVSSLSSSSCASPAQAPLSPTSVSATGNRPPSSPPSAAAAASSSSFRRTTENGRPIICLEAEMPHVRLVCCKYLQKCCPKDSGSCEYLHADGVEVGSRPCENKEKCKFKHWKRNWEEDDASNKCPCCEQPFTTFRRRRHHCRSCGGLCCDGPLCWSDFPPIGKVCAQCRFTPAPRARKSLISTPSPLSSPLSHSSYYHQSHHQQHQHHYQSNLGSSATNSPNRNRTLVLLSTSQNAEDDDEHAERGEGNYRSNRMNAISTSMDLHRDDPHDAVSISSEGSDPDWVDVHMAGDGGKEEEHEARDFCVLTEAQISQSCAILKSAIELAVKDPSFAAMPSLNCIIGDSAPAETISGGGAFDFDATAHQPTTGGGGNNNNNNNDDDVAAPSGSTSQATATATVTDAEQGNDGHHVDQRPKKEMIMMTTRKLRKLLKIEDERVRDSVRIEVLAQLANICAVLDHMRRNPGSVIAQVARKYAEEQATSPTLLFSSGDEHDDDENNTNCKTNEEKEQIDGELIPFSVLRQVLLASSGVDPASSSFSNQSETTSSEGAKSTTTTTTTTASSLSGVGRIVDGLTALIIYTLGPPKGPHLNSEINAAMRIAFGSSAETTSTMTTTQTTMTSAEDAAFVTARVKPFIRRLSWMLREVLPRKKKGAVVFRGISFQIPNAKVGSLYPLSCFTSTSTPEKKKEKNDDTAEVFASAKTLLVMTAESGCSIAFASVYGSAAEEEEEEVLIPPGANFEVVARASRTLLTVLQQPPRRQLLTLREAGAKPDPELLLRASRLVAPVFDQFKKTYEELIVVERRFDEIPELDRYVKTGVMRSGNFVVPEPVPLDRALDASREEDILICGDSATGKTAAAVFALIHFSSSSPSSTSPMMMNKSRSRVPAVVAVGVLPEILPVFLPAPNLTRQAVVSKSGLDRAIASALGCDVKRLRKATQRFSVVVILDSLDESSVPIGDWHNLLHRNQLAQQCRFIITSRPTPLCAVFVSSPVIFSHEKLDPNSGFFGLSADFGGGSGIGGTSANNTETNMGRYGDEYDDHDHNTNNIYNTTAAAAKANDTDHDRLRRSTVATTARKPIKRKYPPIVLTIEPFSKDKVERLFQKLLRQSQSPHHHNNHQSPGAAGTPSSPSPVPRLPESLFQVQNQKATPLTAVLAARLILEFGLDQIPEKTTPRELIGLFLEKSFEATKLNLCCSDSNNNGDNSDSDSFQHAKLQQEGIERLSVELFKRNFHCTLGEAKRFSGCVRVADFFPPCRVEDEDDDTADFSLLHRSITEHLVVKHCVRVNSMASLVCSHDGTASSNNNQNNNNNINTTQKNTDNNSNSNWFDATALVRIKELLTAEDSQASDELRLGVTQELIHELRDVNETTLKYVEARLQKVKSEVVALLRNCQKEPSTGDNDDLDEKDDSSSSIFKLKQSLCVALHDCAMANGERGNITRKHDLLKKRCILSKQLQNASKREEQQPQPQKMMMNNNKDNIGTEKKDEKRTVNNNNTAARNKKLRQLHIQSKFDLAASENEVKNFRKSMQILEDILPEQEDIYGKDSLEVGFTLAELAQTYNAQGLIVEANRLLNRANAIFRQLGEDGKPKMATSSASPSSPSSSAPSNTTSKSSSSVVLSPRHWLGLSTTYVNLAETVRLLPTLSSRSSSRGCDDDINNNNIYNDTTNRFDMDSSRRSISLLQRAMHIREDLFGRESVMVAQTMRGVALAMWKVDYNCVMSKNLMEQCVKVLRSRFGVANEEFVGAVRLLANMYGAMFQVEKQCEALTQLVESAERMLELADDNGGAQNADDGRRSGGDEDIFLFTQDMNASDSFCAPDSSSLANQAEAEARGGEEDDADDDANNNSNSNASEKNKKRRKLRKALSQRLVELGLCYGKLKNTGKMKELFVRALPLVRETGAEGEPEAVEGLIKKCDSQQAHGHNADADGER